MCTLRKSLSLHQAMLCRSRVNPHFTLNNRSVLDFLFPLQMGSQFDESLSEDELWLSFLQLLGLLSRELGPVVLALDDLHYADEASLRLLDALCDNPHLSHVLIVATSLTKPVRSLMHVTKSLSHELTRWLRIQKSLGKGLTTLTIPPLNKNDAQSILEQSYSFSMSAARDFASYLDSTQPKSHFCFLINRSWLTIRCF
jgi:predicted ATPase